jgi:hypothetical protein
MPLGVLERCSKQPSKELRVTAGRKSTLGADCLHVGVVVSGEPRDNQRFLRSHALLRHDSVRGCMFNTRPKGLDTASLG